MLAETAYNVIQALPEKEMQRLYKMLGVQTPSVKVKTKKKPLITEQEATDYLMKRLYKNT